MSDNDAGSRHIREGSHNPAFLDRMECSAFCTHPFAEAAVVADGLFAARQLDKLLLRTLANGVCPLTPTSAASDELRATVADGREKRCSAPLLTSAATMAVWDGVAP